MADSIIQRAVPEDVRTVPIAGLPLAMVTITSVFLFVSVISNTIRVYVNTTRRSFGLDDYLIIFSQCAFVAIMATTAKAALKGVGTKNSGLNAMLLMESQKWYFMWIIGYLLAMVTLKTAVCVTLLRILPQTQRKMRIAVWVLLTICWTAWAVDFLAVLLLCRPIEAAWNSSLVAEGKAECGDQVVLIIVSHILTAASITTDIGCTVLPGIMLWRTQMHSTSKLEIFALLSIASVASIATIVRAPYFAHYSNPENDLSYWCGFMLLYSNIEMGIGLFASALPAIRRFYHILFKPEHPLAQGNQHSSHQLATFGSSGRHGMGASGRRDHTSMLSRAEGGKAKVYRPGDWEQLTDTGSDKGILISAGAPGTAFEDHDGKQIRVEKTIEVATENVVPHR